MLVFAGVVSLQLGAGLAARMFSQTGPAGMTGLRLWWAALIMAAFGCRAVARTIRGIAAERTWRDLVIAIAFGLVLGVMNYSIYQSFARIPLGVAVTIEFLGPLAVAIASSRRRLDLLWVVLAAAGVLLLTQGGVRLASGFAGRAGSDPAGPLLGLSTTGAGLAFALIAGTCWAAYIMLSRATGQRFGGSSGLVIALIVAALLVTGPAVAQAGPALTQPGPVAEGLAVGLLSSVVPYRLELEALRRVPAAVFGIWMSLEPTVAALVGLALLGEALVARQWLAILLVVIASAGAAKSAAGPSQPPAEMTAGVPPPAS